MSDRVFRRFVLAVMAGAGMGLLLHDAANRAVVRAETKPAAIGIDAPLPGSLFPPEIAPPSFYFRDESSARVWRVTVDFGDGAQPLKTDAAAGPASVGAIDERTVASSNRPPELPARLAGDRVWRPTAPVWEEIKRRSRERTARMIFEGRGDGGEVLSRGEILMRTSADPVGAPIFYRDVPLIPSKSETGVIKPLAQSDLPLLAWRLRDIAKPESKLLLTGMHTCANCHSFSADGKTMGMDLDGPGNDKGLYFLADVKPRMTVETRDVLSWSAIRDKESATARIGFMSQVSPDGTKVITMLRGLKSELAGSYFVVNFPDYRFLQVFYPTRGTLAWYDRGSGQVHPLPGADDPKFVQTNPVWSPDGKYIVFARALARDPLEPGQKLPEHALDPEETQIRFDLYRIPFNEGRGGMAEPVAGASQNGMSNSFPKITPDGRWMVFVKSRNGLLMRPDSRLWIVPAAGGEARELECNTALMNSWHSFSPNGRWMVFSSKSRSPYTQMFLTHLDAEGHASPAILIENATAANRAVNIPEFVNVAPENFERIEIPAAESYRLYDEATELTARGELEPAIAAWRRVLELDPENAHAHLNLGVALQVKGDLAGGGQHLERAKALDGSIDITDSDLGLAFLNREQFQAAVKAGNCADVLSYGEKLLAASPRDEETARAVTACKGGKQP